MTGIKVDQLITNQLTRLKIRTKERNYASFKNILCAMNNNRTTKHRLVYTKDKQKQIDNSSISQAVYLWLTNELGYRSGRSTSIVDDVTSDKEITKEDIQKYDTLDDAKYMLI